MLARVSAAAVLLLVACACDKSTPTSPSGGSSGPRTLYVSLSGTNANDGSANAPWRTLRHAVAQLQAGDTLYLRGGAYTGPENTIDSDLGTVRSGTSWTNAVTIAGYPGETAILQPPSNVSAVKLKTGDPSYVIVQDLTLDMVNSASVPNGEGASAAFISNGAHHIRLLRVEMKNGGGHGLQIYGWGSHNEVVQCHIHHNGTASQGFNQAYGMYVSTSDNLIEGNDIHHNNGYGLHIFNGTSGPAGDTVHRNVIRNNNIHDNGTGGGTNYGIVVARGDGNVIHDNEIDHNRGGILVYTNSTNAQVYNNTLRSMAPYEGILIQFARATVVRDNRLNGSTIVDLGVDTVLSNNH
jgi:parallel beta-helix repeat protein